MTEFITNAQQKICNKNIEFFEYTSHYFEYDKNGNYDIWWSPKDLKKYKEDECSEYNTLSNEEQKAVDINILRQINYH